MSTAQSYRAFTLQALRTGPLEIAEKISEHKGLIDEAKHYIQHHVFRLVLYWSLALSAFISLTIGLVFWNVYLGIVLFILLVAASFAITNVGFIKKRLMASTRYSEQQQQIERSTQAIDELRQHAKNYQNRLEINEGPGFIATFMDVLLNPYYPSFFAMDDRLRFVSLSESGRGSEIDLFEYAKLLFEIKANGIEEYTGEEALINSILPQNKYNAALAYARLIAFDTSKATEDEMRQIALVGYNAWLVYQAQGRPANWENQIHVEWDMAKTILENGFRKNTLGLARAVSEYRVLAEKLVKRND